MKPIFLLAVPLFFPANLRADWQWNNDLAVAKTGSDGYEARFTFETTGTSPISVGGLNFSCTCTVYHYEAAAARLGKSGALVVHVNREGNATPGQDLSLIVWGSAYAMSKELTIHIPSEKSER